MLRPSGHVTPMVPLQQVPHKPKVGLAVICRCCSGNSYVQCLLQRRGPLSSSPDKWSFPGGRLEQPGDLEDDGAVGTKRELEEECGGGDPPGLPPLIHIECCKSGKMHQTLYHVYVVDTSMNKEWEHWQPKLKNGKSADIDTSPHSLTIQDQTFPCVEGYCWVDMSTLIQECFNLQTAMELNMSQLQHGLVRWVQNYGEHILKTLIARSPKLPHPRRHSNSMTPGGVSVTSSINGHGSANGTSVGGGVRPPRPPSVGRSNKYGSREGMLVPPAYLPSTSFRPPTYPLLGSPTNVYYGMVPTLSAVGQMSPTGTGGSGTAGYPAAAGAVGGIPGVNPAGVLVQVPPQMGVAGGLGAPPPHSVDSTAVSGGSGSAHQPNILYMQPLGVQPQVPHLQTHVSLSGSPIQQHEFTHPSSPVGFKAPPTLAAVANEGAGGVGVAGGEGTVQHQQPGHLTELVTMTPIMAASASPSSSLNLSHGLHHHHPLQPHPLLSSHQVLQAQAAAIAAAQSSPAVSGNAGVLLEHVPQVVRPVGYQEGHAPHVHPAAQHGQPLLAHFHHQGVVAATSGGEGVSSSSAGTTTGTRTTNLPLMPPPIHQFTVGTGGTVTTVQRNESEPLLPNPPIPPLQPAKHVTSVAAGSGSGAGGGASSSSSHHGNQSSKKEIPCKHFIAGTCPFGEKCWFAHLEPITAQQLPQREGAGSRQLSSASSGPLQVQIPPNMWINNPNVLLDLSRFAVPSPPQSPLNSTLVAGNRPPILPTLVRPRAYYPGFSGQQQLLFVRQPGGAVFPAGVQGVGGGAGYPFYAHTSQYPSLPPQVNPILKFNLLSEVVVKQQIDGGQEMLIKTITDMVTRADHFYIAYGQVIHDYKILFGGNRSFQESSLLVEKKLIAETISCLHFSKQQPSMVVIGTAFGSIYTWDIRKGATGGMVTSAHKAELTGQQTSSISVLIHFATSINSAQVIVAGNRGGHVTWFISQPPQKTYSVLYSDQTSHAPHPIVALQILGGFLITGDRSGRVILWSMQTQQPVIDSSVTAHSISLCNIHVIDNTRFITIGLNPYPDVSDERASEASATSSTGRNEALLRAGGMKVGAPSTLESVVGSMAADFSKMSVNAGSGRSTEEHALAMSVAASAGMGGSAIEVGKTASQHPDYFVSIWEFNRPPKLVHTLPVHGAVISSSFNYHLPTGNMFLATGLQNGTVKIFNIPLSNFTGLSIASELHFSEMVGKECLHVAINLSREVPLNANAYLRNPFRDLILTTVWSDGKIMVCQVARQ